MTYVIVCNDTEKRDNGQVIGQSPLWGRYVVSFWSMDFCVFIVVYN